MQQANINHAVLKQECPSPKSLWGIFCVRNARGVKEAKKYEEDPRRQPSGMTTYLYIGQALPDNKGFTLLELLVVILIIAILAAIALPQYQKVIEKNRATQALTLLRVLGEAQELYYDEHGFYPTDTSQWDIALPNGWQGSWTLYLNEKWKGWILLERKTGAYKGGGFQYVPKHPPYAISGGFMRAIAGLHIVCTERSSGGINFKKKNGDYCQKLFKGTFIDNSNIRYYKLP